MLPRFFLEPRRLSSPTPTRWPWGKDIVLIRPYTIALACTYACMNKHCVPHHCSIRFAQCCNYFSPTKCSQNPATLSNVGLQDVNNNGDQQRLDPFILEPKQSDSGYFPAPQPTERGSIPIVMACKDSNIIFLALSSYIRATGSGR